MHISNASVPIPFRGAVQGHFSNRVFPGPRWAIYHQGCAQGGKFVIEEFNIFYHSSKNNKKTRIGYNMIGLIGCWTTRLRGYTGRKIRKGGTTFRWLMQKCGPYGYQVDRELKNDGQQYQKCNSGPSAPFTGISNSLQQNYDNYQLVVTQNEIVSLYCLDYPLNDPPSFLSGLSLELGSS